MNYEDEEEEHYDAPVADKLNIDYDENDVSKEFLFCWFYLYFFVK